MERGPVALFGAIVAIGLGPALWLGAQFGTVNVPPVQPPAVVGEQKLETGKSSGGAGAATEEPVIEPTRAGYVPLSSSTPSARSSATATAVATEPDGDPTTEPTASAEPTPSAEPTTSPTEDTPEPTDPPSDGGGEADATDPVPPDPADPTGDSVTVNLAGR